MAAATDGYRGSGYDWRSTSIRHSSPDTVSPLYPDRPIRPLPKRRLRARLSPEQAESMTYPSPPVSSPPVFDFPYTHPDKVASVSTRQQRGEREHKCSCGADHSEPESEEEEDERLGWSRLSRKRSDKGLTHGAATGGTIGSSVSKPIPPGSTSSADGYESFENTNNKKKRKIPVSGSAGHHGNLTAEMASMGISGHCNGPAEEDGGNSVGQYYGNGSSAVPVPGSGTGISGAGRGRYGRSAARSSNERRPLGASTSSLNAYANGNASRARTAGTGTTGKGMFYFGGKRRVESAANEWTADHGIISTAIANANAASNSSPKAGKENVSLLQQEAAKTTPQKTQFTFTCGSPNQINWPSQNPSYPGSTDPRAPPPAPSTSASRIPLPSQNTRGGVSTHGTQTSPQMNGAQHPAPPPVAANGQPAPPAAAQQQAPPKKPRRRPEKIYAVNARRRRLEQEYATYKNPPAREDVWICEFCEYEAIFGEPPRALIQQYEKKDHKEQKRLQEKRRLLEKAKMKGRKGKKTCKNASRGATTTNNNQHNQQHGHAQGGQHYDHGPADHGAGQEEEYFEDDYDDPTAAPDSQSEDHYPDGDERDQQDEDHIPEDEEYADGYVPPPVPSEPPDTAESGLGVKRGAGADAVASGAVASA